MVKLKLHLHLVDQSITTKEINAGQVPRVGDLLSVDTPLGKHFIVWDVVWLLDEQAVEVRAEHTSHLRDDQVRTRRSVLLESGWSNFTALQPIG